MAYTAIKQSSGKIVLEFNGGFEAKKMLKLPPVETIEDYDYEGCVRYNPDESIIEYHNGIEWVPLAGGGTGNIVTLRGELTIDSLYENTQLIGAEIVGFVWVDRVPYDHLEDDITFDSVMGRLDFGAIGLLEGSKILVVIKST